MVVMVSHWQSEVSLCFNKHLHVKMTEKGRSLLCVILGSFCKELAKEVQMCPLKDPD